MRNERARDAAYFMDWLVILGASVAGFVLLAFATVALLSLEAAAQIPAQPAPPQARLGYPLSCDATMRVMLAGQILQDGCYIRRKK